MIEQILQEMERKCYAFLPSLLTASELEMINSFFDSKKDCFTPAKVGGSHNRQRIESLRGDYTFWIDPLDPPRELHRVLKFLEEVKQSINQRLYLGLRELECHMAYYPSGSFYKKHLDRLESSSTRTLSFVFYLNSSWNKDNGGELILYNKENEIIEKINPMPGSFICFLSDEFPHEVKSAKIERRSLTGWMHTKIIY